MALGHRPATIQLMNLRVIELVIRALDDRAFEDLVFALVQADHETARQLHPPDVGRDIVVDGADGRREWAWQAKHHTAGINWNDCKASLKTAVEARNPERMTFVFAAHITAGKERGLREVRSIYPESKIEICEPWTLATLRERVANHPEIRRTHIDPHLDSLVSERVEERLERFAAQQQRWTEQTDAALSGPLRVCGQHEAAAEALAAVQRRDWPAAADRYEQLADAVRVRFPSVADALLLRAARAADELGDRPRAARLYLVVSSAAARRGDSVADFAAFRASWLLPEDERWRAHAAMARAAWPEQPEDNIDALVAFARGCGENLEDLEEWTSSAVAALAAQGDWATAKELAERAILQLGPIRGPGPRLELELDLLDASAALGEDIEYRLRKLALSDVGRQAETGGQIAARWGCAEARRGRLDEACAHFREAAARWRDVPGEDEIAEAVFSQYSARQLLGDADGIDQVDLIAAAELRRKSSDRYVTRRAPHERGPRCMA